MFRAVALVYRKLRSYLVPPKVSSTSEMALVVHAQLQVVLCHPVLSSLSSEMCTNKRERAAIAILLSSHSRPHCKCAVMLFCRV
jgi:hypothetical protein